jgi:UDP-glucuronate 4-epimerase
MANERFLVTGALGCIGAWVVRNLVQAGLSTTVLDLAHEPHRMKLIMSDEQLAAVRFMTGDITDLVTVERALAEAGATHLIHLAALQVPACQADPPLGARVNVVGTVNIFEAARRAGLARVVYASSAAVYGLSEEYPAEPVAHDAPLLPRTHYGVYKQANEGNARVYWLENGLSSLGLRPYVVYGPGRDQGLTSGPTKAMLAAAAGQPYHIGFGGRFDLQFADDVARV